MQKIQGYDDAIIGPAMLWNSNIQGSRVEVLVYDAEVIRESLMRKGMGRAEAREYIEYVIESAYLGPDTPILVWSQDQWSQDD